MSTREEIVANLVEAAGGVIVGRIRLQKMFYLFQQLGMKGGFDFVYHHYGPYSEALSIAVQRAALINKSIREQEKLSEFGGRFSEFTLLKFAAPRAIGDVPFDSAEKLASRMKKETSVVIELAATIHWLTHKEAIADWKSELSRRKPGKASDDNVAKATELLKDLALAA